MCRSIVEGGRRCMCGSGSPVVEAATDLLGAAVRDENKAPARFRSSGYYRYRSAARSAWRSTVKSVRERLTMQGVDPYADVPATKARTALSGAIRQVEGMGWVSPVERRTAVRRLSRAQKNARRQPLSRVVLTALLQVVSQLVLGRDNARRVYALAGLVEAARLQREQRERDEAARAALQQEAQHKADMTLLEETFEVGDQIDR